MGKSYQNELAHLGETYAWARALDIAAFAEALNRSIGRPLMVVGSGGSFSGAHAIAKLHEAYSGSIARAATPLEAIQSPDYFDQTDVVLLSAGGRNPDVMIAFERLLEREPRSFTIITGRDASPLGARAAGLRSVNLITLKPPAGRDGYLATNSLVALTVAGARAYQSATLGTDNLPKDLDSLMGQPLDQIGTEITLATEKLWPRQSILILYSRPTSTAAIDVESKFVEAGLGAVHIADFRNFAHGRHQWLARFPDTSAVLAFCSEEDERLADATLKLIPDQVATARFVVPSDPAQSVIASVVMAILITGAAGVVRGIDPGRPHVPRFGRQLYHSKALRTAAPRNAKSSCSVAAARKARVAAAGQTTADVVREWESACDMFLRQLENVRFRGIVFDYDGTLCDRRDRFSGVSSEVVAGLNTIAASGLPIGVATGRGSSVVRALREVMPKPSWKSLVVGQYNGALACMLDAGDVLAEPESSAELTATAQVLCADPYLATLAKITARPFQVTAELRSPAVEHRAWDAVCQIVFRTQTQPLTIVRSSHSIDVLAPGVSKRNVLKAVRVGANLANDEPLLCIGDRGRWPGNDFELLDEPFSLSVDEVSPDRDRCWHLAPAGVSNAQALAFYLEYIEINDGFFRLRSFR